ncbi:MAG: hypothetical protein M3O88_04565 [Actinomycetota bacterium]|nr:hypothetical protein [Actinomycetota bacterium]
MLRIRAATANVVSRNVLWPPGLAPAPGWYVKSSGPLPRGTRRVPFAAASTAPFADGPNTYPDGTAKRLSPDGVVIHASLPLPKDHPRQPNPNFPRDHLRFRVRDFTISHQWEGQVAPNVPEYTLRSSVGRQLVEVRMWFGTQRPSPETLSRAERELHTLSIPPSARWPRTDSGRCTQEPTPGTYAPLLSGNAGVSGSSFEAWGAVPTRVESGRYEGPTPRIEFWWNLDPSKYWTVMQGQKPSPAAAGPIGLLGARAPSEHCNYRLRMAVPDVPPGVYTITPVEAGGGGSTSFQPLEFVVTSN